MDGTDNKIALKSEEERIDPKRRFDWLRFFTHVAGILPIIELIFRAILKQLSANPIQYILHSFGHAGINLLVITLAFTPIVTVTGWKKLVRHRRALGLYSFFYVALHFITYVVFDYRLNFPLLFRVYIRSPYLIIGSIAGVLLFVLALTSFKYWKNRLGQYWKKVHKFIYLISLLAVLHYALAIKGSILSTYGVFSSPLSVGILVAILLVLRIPQIRRKILSTRIQKKRERLNNP